MKQPLKNAAAFLLGDVGTRLLGFAITVYCARVLSPDGFGLISIGFAVLGQLAFVASPGISLLEMRNAAAAAGGGTDRVNGVVTLRVILAVLICTATWLIVRKTTVPDSSGPVTLLYVTALVPMAFSLEWFFQGKERMGIVSASRIVTYLLYGVSVLFLVRGRGDAPLAAISFAIGSWGGSLLLLAAYWRVQGMIELRWRPKFLLGILKENLPVGAGMFFSQLVVNFPPIILSFLVTRGTVGTFSAAAKVAFLFLMVDRLFNALFLPIFTRQLTTNQEGAERLFRISLKGVVIAMAGVAAAGVLLAPFLASLLFGAEYSGSAPLLQIMMAYVLLTVIGSVFVCAIMAAGATGAYLRVALWGGTMLVIAVVAGAFTLGAQGAAYGMIIGEAASVLFAMREANKVLPFDATTVVSATLLSIGGILLIPVVGAEYGMLAAIGTAVAVLGATITIMGGIRTGEIQYVRDRVL